MGKLQNRGKRDFKRHFVVNYKVEDTINAKIPCQISEPIEEWIGNLRFVGFSFPLTPVERG